MNATKNPGAILVIEDEPNISALVVQYLENAGYEALAAFDGAKGLELVRTRHPIFIILDLMLPGMDGWEVCHEIRKLSDVPILILTAREEEIDRLLGFSLGADDYVVKPFSPRELVERVKAILRRARGGARRTGEVMRRGELTLEPEKHRVTLRGKEVPLTPSEYRLLSTMMSAPGRVFSRDDLLGHLHLGGEAVVDRVIDVHVGKLRQKIERDSAKPEYILTVYGVGYRFADDRGDSETGGGGEE
jgi:DNA-binding response OmpR family regulator